MNAPRIDFDGINRIALSRYETLLSQFLPGGRRVNGEYVVKNPRRADKTAGSFTINLRKGVWKDFADETVGGSDPISLWAYVFNTAGQADAARILANHLGVPELAADNDNARQPSEPQEWTPIIPVPPDAGQPPDVKWTLDESTGEWAKHPIVARWAYHTADGQLIGYAARVRLPDDADGNPQKDVVPQTYCRGQDGAKKWKVRSFPKPRPLYGLDRLAARPADPVIVFEGEKTAEAGAGPLERAICITWPGGSNAVDLVDIEPLRGRKVALWPDKDAPGYKAMLRLGRRLQPIVAKLVIIIPPDWAPEGWDIADDAPDGWEPVAHVRDCSVPPEQFATAVGLEAEASQPPDAEPEALPPEPSSHQADEPYTAPLGDFPTFGQPLDLFGIQLPPQLPLEILPDSMRDYVADQAALLGCDHSIIGMSALVSAAACINDSIRLQPKRHDPTWKESARLWLAVVGDPSTRKSPAIDKAVRHVKRMNHRMVEANGKAFAEYQGRLDEWKILNKDAKKAGTPLPAPEQPAKKRILVEDITVEALSDVLKDNPRGVLCLKDELTGWFASMDAYKGGGKGVSMDRAHWLEAYNGGPRSIDRVVRGSISIPNWSVCMVGGIQQEMIRRVASNMGHDGLLQRFMVVCARPAVRDVDRAPDMEAMERFGRLFDWLEALQEPTEVVKLSEPAHQCRERVSDYSRKMVAAFDHPHMQAWLGKWDGLFSRLVLLYHVIECFETSCYPTTKPVGGETAARVERLMCGFLLHHAIHFYSEILDANEQTENTRQLARLILAKGLERLTKRDMAIMWRAARKLNDWEVAKIINSLVNYGWLEPDATNLGADGRPRAWHVNPAVHKLFADYAERETARRAEVAATIRELRQTYARDPDDPDSY